MDLEQYEAESERLARAKVSSSALDRISNADVLGRINQFADRYTIVLVECEDEDCILPNYDRPMRKNQPTERKIMPVEVSAPRLVDTCSSTAGAPSADAVSIVRQQIDIREHFAVKPCSEGAALAAHDGNGIIVVAEATGEWPNTTYSLCYHKETSQRKSLVPLPEKPHSLHVLGSAVYVGLSRAVGWVNFDDQQPAFVSVYQRDWQHKAYDMFARKDNMLVAVDDFVYPFYADTFNVPRSGGEPIHLEGWELPMLVNGRYTMAAILGNSLILIHNFAHRGGQGQTITRLNLLEIKDKRGRTAISLQENRMKSKLFTDVPREPLTQWMGVAVHQNMNEIYLAAGSRGLLVLPGDFQPTTKPAKVDLGGCVTSVSVPRDEEIWATVQANSCTELVKLLADKSVNSRIVLPGSFKLI